jgi:hypothetical protein
MHRGHEELLKYRSAESEFGAALSLRHHRCGVVRPGRKSFHFGDKIYTLCEISGSPAGSSVVPERQGASLRLILQGVILPFT